MKKFARFLRKNSTFNALIRSLILRLKRITERAIVLWPVSGVIDYEIDDISIKLYAEADDALTSKLYYFNRWERDILQWFIFFSREARVVVDAGANIGLFSLAAKKSNDFSAIYSFEPNPYNFDRLKYNIGLNKAADRVKAFPYALGELNGEVSLFLPKEKRISDVSSVYEGHSQSFNDFAHERIMVDCISLDSFFEHKDKKIDLIKIDVELFELFVLKGLMETIKKDRPVIFCEVFNDEIKRKQNPSLLQEIQIGYSLELALLMKGHCYFFYAITKDGLLEVDDFVFTPMSSMYLLFPKKLPKTHYLFSERQFLVNLF